MSSAATAVQRRSAPFVQVAVVRFLEVVVFFGVGIAFAAMLAYVTSHGYRGYDFQTFWQSGHDVLHGHSPYPRDLPTAAHRVTFRPFVYPAPAAVAMVPFALLPLAVANVLWAIAGAAAVATSLRLLGVRDWRCYGAVFAWPAIWSSIDNGTITPFLILGCAALWRYRDRAVVAGALVAALVLIKLYLWPLAIWLLATKRWRASLGAVVMGAVGAFAGWALIGFDGMTRYPQLLARLTSLVGDESYSPYALFRSLGASAHVAELLILAAGGGALAAAVRFARRSGGDAAGFVLTIAAALVLTPVVWPHYFGLACIAVALARRNLHAAWMAPMFLFVPAWSYGQPLLIGVELLAFAGVLAWSARSLVLLPPPTAETALAPGGFGSSRRPLLSKTSA
jgi:Glycosyltransferase family 87